MSKRITRNSWNIIKLSFYEDKMKNKYWDYLHINGGIHVKLHWPLLSTSGEDPALEGAYTSPFVKRVLEPYIAENREDAEKIAKEKLLN
jgi:hypothetical protein